MKSYHLVHRETCSLSDTFNERSVFSFFDSLYFNTAEYTVRLVVRIWAQHSNYLTGNKYSHARTHMIYMHICYVYIVALLCIAVELLHYYIKALIPLSPSGAYNVCMCVCIAIKFLLITISYLSFHYLHDKVGATASHGRYASGLCSEMRNTFLTILKNKKQNISIQDSKWRLEDVKNQIP